jgi:site-specific DNA recombinase
MAGVFISLAGEDTVMTAQGGLVGWAERSALRRAGSLTAGGSVPGRLRFVFYGRVSTEDWQDPVTSRARQREQAETMTMLGLSSKREITRTSIRVRTAMAVQTREQGRYLGGRPPYGYRLADAGPHPNKVHAAWGRRAHRLEPDPRTAPVVRWIFAQRLAGHSVARIARALNEAGVPCPSAVDPGRNPHRTGAGWTLGTVTTILSNPRYTGRQVWNRQRTDTELADPGNVTLGHKSVQRWNLPDGWVISSRPAHPALVSETDFIAAQSVNAARDRVPGGGPILRRYLLAGLLACGVCGRRMESAWSNGKPAYRCRHGRTSATAPDPARPKNAYVREDGLLPHLPAPAPAPHQPPRRGPGAAPAQAPTSKPPPPQAR